MRRCAEDKVGCSHMGAEAAFTAPRICASPGFDGSAACMLPLSLYKRLSLVAENAIQISMSDGAVPRRSD
jgi:hypothetical protein